MTKEEIIKHLHEALNSVDITFPYRYVFIEAIETLSEPDLPSTLDEAAKETAEGLYLDKHNLIWMFKAGAKWMAKQGYSQEEIIEDKSIEVGYGVLPGISPIINLSDSFKPGDKVIIQIRKKQ